MANIEELKKIAEEQGVELTDEMLEGIAGGAIPPEIWDKMTQSEKDAAQNASVIALVQGQPCDLV